jgi:hypothetical protein
MKLKRLVAKFFRKVAHVLDPKAFETQSSPAESSKRVEVSATPKPLEELPAAQPYDAELATHDFHKLICALTDLTDELKLINESGTNQDSTEQFRQMLIDKMELAEVLLIHDHIWDSSKQRAVKVSSDSGSPIQVLSSLRTGVCHRGKIIRKEEVVITK